MKRTITSLLLSCNLAVTGCVFGIPDADPPVKPVKLCQVPIIVDGVMRKCIPHDEVEEELGKILGKPAN